MEHLALALVVRVVGKMSSQSWQCRKPELALLKLKKKQVVEAQCEKRNKLGKIPLNIPLPAADWARDICSWF